MGRNHFLLASIISLVSIQASELNLTTSRISQSHPNSARLRKRRRLQGACGHGSVGSGICAVPALCCSKWGWCGSTNDYCRDKAPSVPEPHQQLHENQPRSTTTPLAQGTCGGGNVGNKLCPNQAQCCSKWGWCGTSSDYCGHTLPLYTSETTLPPTRPTIVEAPTTHRKDACGGGRVGNGVCLNATLCCSKWGWCGLSNNHCGNQAGATIIAPVIPVMTTHPAVSTKSPKQRPSKQANPKNVSPKSIPNPPSKGTCGGGSVGNGICAAAAMCCSNWGFCGTSSDYCVSNASATASSSALITTPVVLPLPVNTPRPVLAGSMQCRSPSDVMTINFGYYASWSRYRSKDCNQVFPRDIDVAGNRYTHLTYAFAGINTTDQLSPWGNDFIDEVTQFVAFNSLKKEYPKLKTLISVGGWSFNDPGPTQTLFSDIAATASRRVTFAASVVTFLQTYGFDGIDIDWEYPNEATRGGRAADVQNFPLLLKAIRDAATAVNQQIVISIAITVDLSSLQSGYNLAALAAQVDFFNLMAYDMNGLWNNPPVTGANADLSVTKASVQYMFQNGVPSNKIVLGLAAYGHTFQLSDPSCNKPGCGFTSGGPGGCAGATGVMPYFTIDQFVRKNNYNSLLYNPMTSSMEMVTSRNVWISYDDPGTFNIKASYAAANCLRGVMWWSVDQLASPVLLGAFKTKLPHRDIRRR